ncbi:MAG: hypothetical protein BYD32DRAFT_425124 [Podila humilis]|nr:MAG: hypothetical protein BYD32DRAFT_425124 [Podila humilis]
MLTELFCHDFFFLFCGVVPSGLQQQRGLCIFAQGHTNTLPCALLSENLPHFARWHEPWLLDELSSLQKKKNAQKFNVGGG